jgi:hypothetical protein
VAAKVETVFDLIPVRVEFMIFGDQVTQKEDIVQLSLHSSSRLLTSQSSSSHLNTIIYPDFYCNYSHRPSSSPILEIITKRTDSIFISNCQVDSNPPFVPTAMQVCTWLAQDF